MLEKTENGLIDREVLDRVPKGMRSYTEAGIGIVGEINGLYRRRREIGFYPPGYTRSQLDELALTQPEAYSPYPLIKQNGGGRVRVVSYKEVPDLNKFLKSIGEKGKNLLIGVAKDRLPQADLIIDSLRSMLQQFSEGDFSGAMTGRLNTLQTPDIELFIGRLDRYDDPWDIKFAEGGWLTIRDNEKTGHYTNILQKAVEKTSDQIGERGLSPAYFRRVLVCEAIATGGLPADMEFSGETIPSEDDKRKTRGSVSYVFLNHLNYNLDKGLRNSLLTNASELNQIADDQLREAIILDLVAHEGIGHPLIGENPYQSMRELEAEILGLIGINNMDVGENVKRATALVSLAWAKRDIDSYTAETDPKKKLAKKRYAISGSILRNFCEMDKTCEINSGGEVRLQDTGYFYRTIASKLSIIRNAVSEDAYLSGSIDRFESLHTTYPRDYKIPLEDNSNHNTQITVSA